MRTFLFQIRSAVLMIVVMIGVTGIAYPLIVTGLSSVAFESQVNGSLISRDNGVVGSNLIGQEFVDPDSGLTLTGYFRGRPSAVGYDASASGASNMGPLNEDLHARIASDVAIIRDENGLASGVQIPIDLVTTSGSGLDPHISRASADLQIGRVAQERNLTEEQVRTLVNDHTEGALLGFFGEERVNVLELNLALDALSST